MAQRPLRADARRNRARILEAARMAFASGGAGVPLDDIARDAGVGAGTVYRHFPTKEALFAAVIADDVHRLTARARDLARSGDPGAAFFDFLRELGTEATARRDIADALAATHVPDPTVSNSDEMQVALGLLLRRAQEAGAVRVDIGITDLVVMLKASLAAVGPQGETGVRERVFAVLADGLRAG